MKRLPPRSTPLYSSAASDVYKRQAFGTGLGSVIAFKDLRILKDNHGKPIVYYKGKKSTNIHLSITHSNEYAAAFAILEG